jgi:DNA-binding protein Fis
MASVIAKKIETVYELTLSEVEAATLRAVLNNCGGSPTHSGRKHTDAINRALRLAGVEPASATPGGSLMFRECEC